MSCETPARPSSPAASRLSYAYCFCFKGARGAATFRVLSVSMGLALDRNCICSASGAARASSTPRTFSGCDNVCAPTERVGRDGHVATACTPSVSRSPSRRIASLISVAVLKRHCSLPINCGG